MYSLIIPVFVDSPSYNPLNVKKSSPWKSLSGSYIKLGGDPVNLPWLGLTIISKSVTPSFPDNIICNDLSSGPNIA